MSKYVKFDDNGNLFLVNIDNLNFVSIGDSYITFNFDNENKFVTNNYNDKENMKKVLNFFHNKCNSNIVKFENDVNFLLINVDLLLTIKANFDDKELVFVFKENQLYSKTYESAIETKTALNKFENLLISKKNI